MTAKKNKRGDLFALYFPLLILTLCGITIFAFVYNQNQLSTNIASPETILKLEDELEIFEHNENILLNELDLSSGTDLDNQKRLFCTNLKPYSKFLTSNIIFNNQKFEQSFWDKDTEWISFCERLYTFTKDENIITIKRENSKKQILLVPETNEKIGFNTKLVFTHSKEYKINLNN